MNTTLQELIDVAKRKIEYLKMNYDGPLKEGRISELQNTIELMELAMVEEAFEREESTKVHS